MKKMIIKEFIEKAKEIHGDKYDYSKVNYINNGTKVEIICKEHGSFFKTPYKHVNLKEGCQKCAILKRTSNKHNFIQKAKLVHGDKYIYDKVEYKNSNTKVCIICKKHGEFWQQPKNHLSGQNCPLCKKRSDSPTTKEFIEKCKNSHWNTNYDYSKTIYTSGEKYITVVCLKHGEFKQRADHHRQGACCPKCSCSKGESAIGMYLDNHNIKYDYQKQFDDCKFINNLIYDFYIPSKNMCIEYDGEQHFKPYKLFGGEENFKIIKERDKLKTEYCKNNNIKLLRISYIEFKNINSILDNFFS